MHQQTMTQFATTPDAGNSPVVPLDAGSVLAYLNELLSKPSETMTSACQNTGQRAFPPAGAAPQAKTGNVGGLLAQIYAERRLRDRVFDVPDLFGEPAWDALLDIAQAELKGERLAVTSACIGSCAPTTTALRWLKLLEERGLVCREADPADARRNFVRLTGEGHIRVERYFKEVTCLRAA